MISTSGVSNSEKNFLRFEVSLLNWDTDQAVFSETRQAAELLQQFGGLFCRTVFWDLLGHAPYPFLPCGLVLTSTAFSSPWHSQLSVPSDNVLALLLR